MTCGFALRNLVDLASFFDELGRVVAARRPDRPARRRRPQQPRRAVGPRHLLRQGRAADRRLLSDPAAYRYLPRSVAYLPAPSEMLALLRDAGFADATHDELQRRHHPAPHRDPLMRAVTRIAEPDVAALDLNDVARGDGYLFVRDGVGIAGRGVAARGAGRRDRRPAGLDRPRRRDRVRRAGPARDRVGAVRAGQPGELVVPAVCLRKTADGRRFVTEIDGACRVAGGAAPAGAVRGGVHDRAGDAGRRTTSPRSCAAREAVRDGRLTKAVIAREIAVEADRPIDRHGVLHRLKATFGSSYRYAVDGLIGASPELLVEVDGEHRAVASAGRHGAAHRRRRASTPRSPPRSSPARRTRSSTGS